MNKFSISYLFLLIMVIASCKKEKITTPTVVGNWTVEAVGTETYYENIKEITWSPWKYSSWKWYISEDLSYQMEYNMPAGMQMDLSGQFTYENDILQSGDGETWETEIAPDNNSMVLTHLYWTHGYQGRTPYRLRRIK